MMKRLTSALGMAAILASTSVAAAQETPSIQEQAPQRIGLTAKIETSMQSVTGTFDANGEKHDLPANGQLDAMLINVNLNYDLMQVPGLYVGVDIPVIRTKLHLKQFNAEDSTTGIGDMSIYAGYKYSVIPQAVRVGAQLRYKAPTGSMNRENGVVTLTGNEAHHVQASIVGDARLLPELLVSWDAGYVAVLGTSRNLLSFEEERSGDVIYSDVTVGYTLFNRVTPRLSVLFQRDFENQNVDGTSIADSDKYALGFAADVDVKVSQNFSIYGGLGTSEIPYGYNLRYGMPLIGKNLPSNGYNFTLGATGVF